MIYNPLFLVMATIAEISFFIGIAFLISSYTIQKAELQNKQESPTRRACEASCNHFGDSEHCCSCIRNPVMLDHYDKGGK